MDGRMDEKMTNTEKITINLGPVDIGRIDVLVEQGIYSSRTDAIRTAVRSMLEKHEGLISERREKQSLSMGVLLLDRKDLLKKKEKGEKLSIRILGALILSDDIEPELAVETIENISVKGVFKASEKVKKALGDRVE